MSVCSRSLLPLSAGLSVFLITTASAQAIPEAGQAPPPRVTRMWINTPDGSTDQIRFWNPRRGRLGVVVNPRVRDTDSIGAFLVGVTPNGPAARAGLRSGDIIVRIDGKAVVNASAATDPTQPGPGIKLLEIAAKLTPVDTVAVEYRRGTERHTTQLVTSDEPEMTVQITGGFLPGSESADTMVEQRFDQMAPVRERTGELRFMGPFRVPVGLADLELAPVNPDLGRYFGVTEGVLVIDVPDGSRLNLKSGDVVLSADGRPLTSPAHLLRILQSYEVGEQIRFDVMRMKKREVILGRIGMGEMLPRQPAPR